MRRWLEASGCADYPSAHAASIADLDAFWSWAWRECGVIGDPGGVAYDGGDITQARFFPEASLNVVETLLAGDVDAEVLVGIDEQGLRRTWTRGQLRSDVASVAAGMRGYGIQPGDRVAAWAPNVPEVMIWALAALSIGAIVSTASPDFAPAGVLDRFGQISPRLLLVGTEYSYAGRSFDMRSGIADVVHGLPSVERVVALGDAPNTDKWTSWLDTGDELLPTRFPFDHPGFILFSSGTTGAPKCIVHSAAGVLLKDLVEQRVHLDIAPGDRISYYTTCGWMMWNWLLMALGTGATVVLYDGQPMFPREDQLLHLARQERLSFLGVSAKFIESLREKSVKAGSLEHLRTLASTGSPLAPELFDYVYENIGSGIHLASISGGTDICGCFVLGVPIVPVMRGEIQGPALGMDVQAFGDDATPVPTGERGELVCTTAFPSRPLGFWGDDGARFRASYFERFPGAWAHGDFIARTPSGGFVIHGRSDATLNAGGIRIGTAEIYRVVDALDEISESIVVGQRSGVDTRIVLFVVMADGHDLTDEVRERIRTELRNKTSPRHVPAKIVSVPAVPRTITGKLAELAVTDIVNHDPVRNTSGLADPDALDAFAAWVTNDG
jgi:acetoacetyl-CoA synthetase